MFDTLLIITLFLIVSLLVCLLSLRLSINVKNICLFFHSLPILTDFLKFKSFVRPHLDYGYIIYDQPQNDSFCNKLESVQYNAALTITEHQKLNYTKNSKEPSRSLLFKIILSYLLIRCFSHSIIFFLYSTSFFFHLQVNFCIVHNHIVAFSLFLL